MIEDPVESDVSQRSWHWLYSVRWWGHVCLAFSVVLVLLGLDSLLAAGEDSISATMIGLAAMLALPLSALALLASICPRAGKGSEYPVKPIKWHRRILALSFLFAMLAIMIPMYRAAFLAAQLESNRTTAEAAANAPWVKHPFGADKFVTETPSNWVRTTIPDYGRNGCQLTDTTNQLTVVVIATPKTDTTVRSLEILNQMAITNLKTQGANHQVVGTAESQRSGHPFRQTMVEWENGAQNLVTIIRQTEFPDHWVEVIVTCAPSGLSAHEDRLTKIADSVQMNDVK